MSQLIEFMNRHFPSANMVLIRGRRPILIDSGYGGDIQNTFRQLMDRHVQPENIRLIVNTHYHSDHVGGNAQFQQQYRTVIAAHTFDAQLINHNHHESCCSYWLDQSVENYRVDMLLHDGDEVSSDEVALTIVHTPGHTLGHISLYAPEFQTLIAGDLFHRTDVGWINIFREGVASIPLSLESLDKISKLDVRIAYSGHGEEIPNPQESIDSARRRLTQWLSQPERAAWHACKRIFAYALMIRGGIHESDIEGYLTGCPWFSDLSRNAFHLEPKEFVQPFMREIMRAKVAEWSNGKLMAAHPHTPSDGYWNPKDGWPDKWRESST